MQTTVSVSKIKNAFHKKICTFFLKSMSWHAALTFLPLFHTLFHTF